LASRFDEALEWMRPLIGDMPYGWWTHGPVPSGPPAYAQNAKVPGKSQLHGKRIFCAGVPNLLLRHAGKVVPFRPSLPPDSRRLYDGGTWAYSEYFHAWKEGFTLNKDYPHGTLVGRPFRVNSADQGHVAIVLGNKRVLQSYDMDQGWPGLNAADWLATAHDMIGFTYAVMPWNWINYEGDERL
jgi:hypothetical protein